jgi:di/tricarboxylate transporter
MAIWGVSGIILAALFFLITETIPVDLTAIGIIVLLMVSGILSAKEAVAGFANPAVITVGAMFLISRAMVRTGAVGFVGEKIIAFSRGNAKWTMLLILLIVAVASAFINNTPVVVLFIPILLSVSCEYDFSPSKFLIPISYASILAGTCTLIGTSTNIIVSDLSAMYGYGELGMFELSMAGVPIAIVGLAFLFLASPSLMPGNATPTCELEDRADRRYLAEFQIPEGSPFVGKEPAQAFVDKYPSFRLFEIARHFHILNPAKEKIRFFPSDLFLVKGSLNDIVTVLQDGAVTLPYSVTDVDVSLKPSETIVAELIIPPQSSLLGAPLMASALATDLNMQVIAVKRRSFLYTAQKITNMRLQVGDILLIRCTEERLTRFRGDPDFIIVEDVHHEIVHKRKAPLVAAFFLGLVAAATTGMADIMVCALAALFLMVLTGCLPLREAYRALQGNVLILIAGTIALGTAMEKTGAAAFYAKNFLVLFQGYGPMAVLGGILLLTSISTQVLSNNATAVLLFPIAVSTALSLGVDPKPFIVAVCFGASACFAAPIGYQTNLLVYGPGGYRFKDYLKLGIPLNLIVLLMGLFLIPRFWPF